MWVISDSILPQIRIQKVQAFSFQDLFFQLEEPTDKGRNTVSKKCAFGLTSSAFSISALFAVKYVSNALSLLTILLVCCFS